MDKTPCAIHISPVLQFIASRNFFYINYNLALQRSFTFFPNDEIPHLFSAILFIVNPMVRGIYGKFDLFVLFRQNPNKK